MKLNANRFFEMLVFFVLAVSDPTDILSQDKVPLPTSVLKGEGTSQLLVDAPHWSNGVDCMSCHVVHNSADAQLTKLAGNANLCMSCHNSAGMASNKPFTNADRADPGVSGTSHAWAAPATNPTHGAEPPSDPEMALRIYSGNIVCSTCHNQHSQAITPFLRASNYRNSLCKDCHAVRDVGSYSTSTNNKGSHPVGIVYPTSDERFHSSPQNPDLPLIDPDLVECTTCHNPHNADSGGANGGAGDGYILRTANNDVLCQACHTYETHMGQGCRKCHDSHDPDHINIFLVNSTVATPNSGSKPVVFTSETGSHSFADGDANYNGICEVCHTATNYHRNNSSGDHSHNVGVDCVECHPHEDSFMPSGCVECHTVPQDDGDGTPIGGRRAIASEFDAASHHVTTGVTDDDCVVCHDQSTHMDGYLDIYDPDGGPSYRAVSFTQGLPMEFCLNCHDGNGATAHGGLTPFSDGVNVIDVSAYYTTGGHGNQNPFPFIGAQVPITDPMSGQPASLYGNTANPGANVTCTDCHSSHGSSNDPILKYANNQNNTLCSQCHPTATSGSGYYLTYHNRTMANYEASDHGNLLCSNCHDPHGTGNAAMSKSAGDALCLNCHNGKNSFRDMLGNVNYDHGVNGCSKCHNPHSTGFIPLLYGKLEQSPSVFCTDAMGQQLPVIANPATNLQLCVTCHPQAFPPISHDPTRCVACHGWYDDPVLGQACGFAPIKTFVDFKVHDDGASGGPVDLGFSGLCLDCHFCGGDCGQNPPPILVAKSADKKTKLHGTEVNCFECHNPHKKK